MNKQEVQEYLIREMNVSRETLDKLEIYVQILQKWQKHINLISSGTLENVWNRHILDSAQILKFVSGGSILDVGSGAGFPGAIIAIMTNFDVTCLDSDTRKCLFLKEAFFRTGVECRVENCRIETFLKQENNFKTVTARGFSKLTDLLSVTCRYNCEGIFLKGKKYLEEIEIAREKFVFHVEHFMSVTDKCGKILKISNVQLKRVK